MRSFKITLEILICHLKSVVAYFSQKMEVVAKEENI